MKRIVLAGGGSGGHIFPLVTVAKKIKEKRGDVEFLYLGSKSEMEREAMYGNNIPIKYVMSGKLRRYFSFANFFDLFKLPIGIIQSLWHLLWYMPDAIFSKGGHGAVPVAIAAWIYSIPILTHESDAMPGLANKIIGVLSERVAISYPFTKKYFSESKVLLTGNPIREDINKGSKDEFLKNLKLTSSRPIILILGGSQGAQGINLAIANILPDLIKISQVVHQTGKNNYKETVDLARLNGIKENRDGYYPTPFINPDELKNALKAADLIISRAGANSISEIAANKKPAILIPHSAAASNNHQGMNAYFLAEKGGAVVLEESNIGKNMLITNIEKILSNEDLQKKLSENIGEFYHEDASEKISQGVLDLV